MAYFSRLNQRLKGIARNVITFTCLVDNPNVWHGSGPPYYNRLQQLLKDLDNHVIVGSQHPCRSKWAEVIEENIR